MSRRAIFLRVFPDNIFDNRTANHPFLPKQLRYGEHRASVSTDQLLGGDIGAVEIIPDAWLTAPWAEVAELQRPMLDGALQVVARDQKQDESQGEAVPLLL